MDTKWKKWKSAGSLTAFLLGLYLLFLSFVLGGAGLMRTVFYGEGMEGIRERMETDYQNTSGFRWFVSNRLEELLLMACGGEMGGYYGVTYEGTVIQDTCYYDDWGWDWGMDFWFSDIQEAVAVAEEGKLQEVSGNFGYDDYYDDYYDAYYDDYYDGYYDDYDTGEQKARKPPTKEERILRRQEELKPDQNVLYQVSYDGEILYTNAEGVTLDETGKTMPEGYNFLLYFDGEKTHLYKDGQELDIYGNPYYESGERQWYVPGYYNFYVDEAAKNARVLMAVAENPRLYIQGRYDQDGNSQYGSQLYWMERSQNWQREEFIRNTTLFFLGLVLLFVALILRKQKKTADQWVAKKTKKCWVEGKLLICLGIPGLLGNQMAYHRGMVYVVLLVDILLLYVLINDLWQNRGRQKGIFKSLWKSFREMLRTKSLRLPVQKRMVYRQWAAGFAWLLAALLFCTAAWIRFRGYWGMEGSVYILLALGTLTAVAALCLSIRFALYHKRTAEDIGALGEQIAAVRNGNLTGGLILPGENDLREMAENLNTIQQGMNRALEEQMKSERMKVELVSNVSHDIKTPLTSIISYVELLQQEEGLPDHVKDYIQILGRKSQRLKTMVQDVFEVSKASSGQLPVKMEVLDLQRLMSQTLADMDEQIKDSGMKLKTDLPAGEMFVRADGQRMYRVIQNLLQNALKYSLPGSRIHVTLRREEQQAVVRIQNTSQVELAADVDFTERFVRGDVSRSDGGSGLGLSIARSFTEACNGTFAIHVNADLFTAEVGLALERPEAAFEAHSGEYYSRPHKMDNDLKH